MFSCKVKRMTFVISKNNSQFIGKVNNFRRSILKILLAQPFVPQRMQIDLSVAFSKRMKAKNFDRFGKKIIKRDGNKTHVRTR